VEISLIEKVLDVGVMEMELAEVRQKVTGRPTVSTPVSQVEIPLEIPFVTSGVSSYLESC
jgi:hypothetical protein